MNEKSPGTARGTASVLILGIGVALGLAIGPAIRAQQTKVPAAYLAETTVTDAAMFKNHAKQAPGTLAPFGGKFLVLRGKVTPLEGDPPKGEVVVIPFESVQKALDSPANEAIRPIRQKSAKTRTSSSKALRRNKAGHRSLAPWLKSSRSAGKAPVRIISSSPSIAEEKGLRQVHMAKLPWTLVAQPAP